MASRASITTFFKGAAYIFLVLFLGFFGLSLMFGDLGPGESWPERIMTIALFFSVSGLIFGFISPERWQLASLLAWGAVLLGLGSVMANVGRGIEEVLGSFLLLLPLPLTLAAAYVGRYLRMHWTARSAKV
jgi:hypothetical protein